MKAGLDKVLVVSVSGIGNTILATPLLHALRDQLPSAKLDLLVWSPAAGAPIAGSGMVDRMLTAPRQAGDWLRFLRELRATRYDAALTVFPSNKAAYHVFAFLAGARLRPGFAYRGGWRRGEWLLTHRTPAREELHDVDQNLQLLELLGLTATGVDRTPCFHLSPDDHAWAEAWLRERNLAAARLVGMHPGAGAAVTLQHWQGTRKRWPQERFAESAARLAKDAGCTVLLVGGPEENPLKLEVQRLSGDDRRVLAVSGSLSQTAALLSRCRLMISNDSGLMHVAAAVGTPVLALFGPTQASRTAPVGAAHRVLRKDAPCRPCLKYPFHSASSKIRCDCDGACLRDINVVEVVRAAEEMLHAGRG